MTLSSCRCDAGASTRERPAGTLDGPAADRKHEQQQGQQEEAQASASHGTRVRSRPVVSIGRDDDSASSFRPICSVYIDGMPGHWELIVLGLVLLLLFGAKRVPLIGRQLGRSVRELKDTVQDVDPRDDLRSVMDAPEDEARAAGTDRRDEPPAT